ncbi:MAG: hypothetical protein QOG80_260 [Pseudonocardiales bacterium]|jgi:hypothetical protein|nr:hypothetical protein [Pseudonocardiales bacterium]
MDREEFAGRGAGNSSRSGFAALSRRQLATLVPELLLAGQLIDRSALAHVLVALGPDGMRDVAIDEWMGASPVYTRRMQRALQFVGDDVVTIFKGLQLDIGAPPQFMDFRYTVHDAQHGQFELAHCGALLDVAPMGEDYVRLMCHDIEDPTFDATAVATNARAQVRPVYRPPHAQPDRQPHCAWTVTIDPAHPAVPEPAAAVQIAATRAARFDGVTPIDPAEDGAGDYSGPLLADLRFADFSQSALVRLAEEVCLQMHLLVLSFRLALRARTDEGTATEITGKGCTGIAGLAAERIRAALDLPGDLAGAAELFAVHPMTNPRDYVRFDSELGDDLTVRWHRDAPAEHDGAWPSLLDADHLEPVQAILHAVDPSLRAELTRDDGDVLELTVVHDGEPHDELPEVGITRFSTGASFTFADRGNRPALPVI